MATEEEMRVQKDFWALKDKTWLSNFPFNKELGINERMERISRMGTNNTLGFIEQINWPKGVKILELGAGNCWLTAKLAKNYYCVALDIFTVRPRGLESADVYIRQRGIFFERVMADMNALPFRDNSFDIILVNAALHHGSDLIQTLKEIYRALSLKGQLILLNEPSIGWFGGPERRHVIQDIETGFSENRYNLREWIKNFTEAGFESKIYLPVNFLEILRTKGQVFRLFGLVFKLIPSFLNRIMINKLGPIILTFFDGFFNAILYKK